jgi:hypothetical protein
MRRMKTYPAVVDSASAAKVAVSFAQEEYERGKNDGESMMKVVSPEEQKKDEKQLQEFCQEHHAVMYNFMRLIKLHAHSGEDKERDRIVRFIDAYKGESIPRQELMDVVMEPVYELVKKNPYILGPVTKRKVKGHG